MTDQADEKTGSSEHPESREILAYLQAPETAEFSALRLHLATCHDCRRRTETTAMLRQQGHWLEAERVDVDARMDDLLAGKLDARQAAELRAGLQKDPAQLRAALHYASHAHAMQKLNQREERQPAAGWALIARLKQWLSLPAPIWQAVPVAVVMLGVAALLVNQFYSSHSDGQARVVVFQDNSTIRFASQETQPGIGFFTQQGTDSRPFGGMQIELRENNILHLSWPEVEDVLSYRLKLQVFRDGETRLLAKKQVNSNHADLEIDGALTQHRYEWVLSGETADKRSFQTSGGFVVRTNLQ